MSRYRKYCLWLAIGLISIGRIGLERSAEAAIAINLEGNFFYTSDVGLFSSSRRLSLQEDPTQPVVDVTDQGEDVVFEPAFTIWKVFPSQFGSTKLSIHGQGFMFAGQSRFSHGTYGLKVEQTLPSETILALRYHYGPNLLLGKNTDRRSRSNRLANERMTTHFVAGTMEHNIIDNVELRLLGRYGLRFYNNAFAQRDTRFWTIGPHIDWRVLPGIALTVGYHFERGLADGRNQSQFHDDVSYINHYVSTELEVAIAQRTTLELSIHYERNNFTSDLEHDERNGATENVWQGEVELYHQVTRTTTLKMGFQRSQRAVSFEPATVIDVNVWLGGMYQF